MEAAWLYQNLGSLAQILGFSTLLLIGVLAVLRRRKSRRLATKSQNTGKSKHK
jgi:hypothetical protein